MTHHICRVRLGVRLGVRVKVGVKSRHISLTFSRSSSYTCGCPVNLSVALCYGIRVQIRARVGVRARVRVRPLWSVLRVHRGLGLG